jgi:hypothetical protein
MKRLAVAICVLLTSQAYADEAEDMAKLAAGRYDAITSGHLVFTYQNKDRVFSVTSLDFSKDSWAIRYPGGTRNSALINHGGALIEYSENPSRTPGGASQVIVQMSDPRPLEANQFANRPPTFAGSFWSPFQARWVRENAKSFKLVKDEKVNGVLTKVIEATPDSPMAFNHSHPLLENGILRLYVAPSLKGALPRLEQLSATGELVERQDAFNFKETGQGVFTPDMISNETLLPANNTFDSSTNYKAAFQLEFSLVNQALPKSAFQQLIPAGTRVTDRRKGKVANIKVEEATNSDEVAK